MAVTDKFNEEWNGFKGRLWKEEVNTRQFIQDNYKPYDGDESFLADPTEATNKLWGKLQKLQKEERAKGGVLECETKVVSGLTAYGPGYIDEEMKDLEKVVGLQTDKPLKRAFMPYGGIKMAEQAAATYGYEPDEKFHVIFHLVHIHNLLLLMDMNQMKNYMKFSQNIIKHITKQYSMFIHQKLKKLVIIK